MRRLYRSGSVHGETLGKVCVLSEAFGWQCGFLEHIPLPSSVKRRT